MANEIISIENFPQANIAERSILTADALASQAVVNIENASGYSANDFVVVGILGQEHSELKKIQSIATLAVTLTANLASKHYRNEPFTKIRGDKARIYRAANVDGTVPADGSFSLLETIDLQADQLYTEYVDPTGGSGYWYKFTFYNSHSTFESPLADSDAVRGGGYGLYASVEDVRVEAGLMNNQWITDQLIYSKLVQAQSEVNASLSIAGYSLPLTSVPELIRNATQLLAAGYILTIDYGPEHQGTNKDGQIKIKMARDILGKIEGGDTQLLDSVTNAALSQSAGVRGYPDDSAESATPTEAAMFKITDKF